MPTWGQIFVFWKKKQKSQTFLSLAINRNVSISESSVKEIDISFVCRSPSSFSSEQKLALDSLKSYKHLTIKPSDKGGNIVVIDNTQYKFLCLKIFNQFWYYQVPLSLFGDFVQQF